MTLEEIEHSMPNGLHDAQIESIHLDYVKREARFELEVSFSDADKEGPEIYRNATLTLSRFLYCVIEVPGSKYPFQVEKALWVNAGSENSNHVRQLTFQNPCQKVRSLTGSLSRIGIPSSM